MNKKVISAMLAASMAVSLAACGSTATSEATSAVSSETSSTVASGESAASGSYTGTPIKVGGIGPITASAGGRCWLAASARSAVVLLLTAMLL